MSIIHSIKAEISEGIAGKNELTSITKDDCHIIGDVKY